MNTGAEIVCTFTRMCFDLAEINAPSGGPRQYSTGYNQLQLGRLLARQDWATALAIARDNMAQLIESGELPEDHERVINEAHRVRNESRPSSPPRRSRDHVTRVAMMDVATEWVRRIRILTSADEYRLLRYAIRRKSWKALEEFYPGRTSFSIKDDFERLADRIWKVEKYFISSNIDEFHRKMRKS